MDWVLRSPLIHNTFGTLGVASETSYQLGKNCNVALETILRSLFTESRDTFSYRRNLSFGQNIKKDLIPALLSTKDDTTIELIIKILVNLTLPLECLISVERLAKTEFGRHTIFELNNLLLAGKYAFVDQQVTRAVVLFLKQNAFIGSPTSDQGKLTLKQCENINNCILLVRNILRVSEEDHYDIPNVKKAQNHNLDQNQIIWNLFSVGFDKVLLKLMNMPEASQWCVSLAQLTALLFREQNVMTLHKLLQAWIDASPSETSDDNESNTSPAGRSSGDSSPIHTSDSNDSTYEIFKKSERNQKKKVLSENLNVAENVSNETVSNISVGNDKCNDLQIKSAYKLFQEHEVHPMCFTQDMDVPMNIAKPLKPFVPIKRKKLVLKHNNRQITQKTMTNSFKNEGGVALMDCGYGTQLDKGWGSQSSSSNEEEAVRRPHVKPHGKRAAPHPSPSERRRKRLVKRSRINISTSIKRLCQSKPTDEDVSQILKEFALDFLLNGYAALVKTLHNEILVNPQLQIDSSHFFWLVTYFVKFAVQIEVDFVQMSGVLSYDVISYLIAKGVDLCEDLMLAIKLDSEDLKLVLNRLNLLVTSIREIVQALQKYNQMPYRSSEEKQKLMDLQIKMCDTLELRQLPILLIRSYDPKYHNKQYLQDVITTNHTLLLFLDKVHNMEEYKGSFNMVDHIQQFASPEMMYQYSLLLEEYPNNGEFVNDCVFTVLHHVAGTEVKRVDLLFQPKILKTFSAISETEYKVCDDWADLIEYVLNMFMKRPHVIDYKGGGGVMGGGRRGLDDRHAESLAVLPPFDDDDDDDDVDMWAYEESNMLKWNYMNSLSSQDVIGDLVQHLKNDGVIKTPKSVVQELSRQNLINEKQYAQYLKKPDDSTMKSPKTTKKNKEIKKLCEQLIQDGKGKCLKWVQELLLDICFTHTFISQQNQDMNQLLEENKDWKRAKANKKRADTRPVVSPIVHYSIMHDKSVPLVSWSAEQATMCSDLKFLQLVHRLGFHMPVDSGRVFVRVPLAWPASHLYRVALAIAPAPTSLVKYNFSLSDLAELQRGLDETEVLSDLRDGSVKPLPDTNFRIHRSNENTPMVQFTPQPCTLTTNKTHWLEIIAKSKEIAIKQSLKRAEIENPSVSGNKAPSNEPTADFRKPETTAIYKMEDDTHNCDDIHSVCETASVVSDLTHMYVSEEEERGPAASALAQRLSALPGLAANPLKRRLLPPSLAKCKTNCMTH